MPALSIINFSSVHPIANSPFVGPPPPPPDSRSATPTQSKGANASERSQSRDTTGASNDDRQVAQRSRWQAMLLEAGGLSAALSEESMRRLKFCLQWLQVCYFLVVPWLRGANCIVSTQLPILTHKSSFFATLLHLCNPSHLIHPLADVRPSLMSI